jgi:tetratricopeptide (TPR) repeat protein
VDYLLEGSVRKAGKRIRITTQLINVEDGYHLWSERYDRDLEDVFAIQDEIALPNMGAYELYLKGRYHFNKFSPEWIDRAIDSFSKAIAIDKEFAPAYAGLADAYIFISTPFGALESNVAMPKAKEAAEKALRLNPNLSEAYVSLGAIATFYDWDSEKAHRYLKRAIELNPNNTNASWADGHLWYDGRI